MAFSFEDDQRFIILSSIILESIMLEERIVGENKRL
jgi:hypothetical protein